MKRLWVWIHIIGGGYLALLAWRYYMTHGVARHRVETAAFVFAALALATVLWSQRNGVRTTRAQIQRPVWWPYVLFLGVAIVATILYAPTLRNGFLSDDFVLARWASDGNYFGTDWAFVRPAPLLVWRVAQQFRDPALLLHALNLLLHLANGTLVVCLARLIGLRPASMMVAGALFMLFPAAVEPVVWLAGMQDVLMTVGVLGFVYAVLTDGSRAIRYPAAVLALALAVLSKETGAVAPALAAAIAWPTERATRRRVWIESAVFGLVAVLYAAWRVASVDVPVVDAPARYVLKEMLTRPYASLVEPWSRDVLRELPLIGVFSAASIVFAVSSGAILARSDERDGQRLIATAAWGLIAALPVYRLLFISEDLQGSRYLYLPGAGWCIFVATLLDITLRHAVIAHRLITATLTIIMIPLNGYALRRHLEPWTEAALARDQVLASGREVTQSGDAHLCGAPTAVRGAYVFQNGLAEALGSSKASQPARSFRWDGRQFSPAEASGADCVPIVRGSR